MMNSILGTQITAAASGITQPDGEILSQFYKSQLDLSLDIPDPQPLVSLDGSPICTRGNLSVVSGVAGSRKSFLCTAIAGAYLSAGGFLGMENSKENGRILWYDTEQAAGHVARIGRRLHRIVGLPTDKSDEKIEIHMLREFSFDVRKQIVEVGIKLKKPDFVVIDGVADLISDVNSSEESSKIVSWLMAISKNYNCHVLTVVHTNPNGSKMRGHLGSEVSRKAETVLQIEANGEISTVEAQKSRDIRPPKFAFHVVNGLPALVSYDANKSNPQERKKNEVADFFRSIMKPNETYRYNMLVSMVRSRAIVCESTSKKWIASGVDLRIITKNSVNEYHLLCEEPEQTKLPSV